MKEWQPRTLRGDEPPKPSSMLFSFMSCVNATAAFLTSSTVSMDL